MSRVTGKTMGLVALLLFCVVPIFAQQDTESGSTRVSCESGAVEMEELSLLFGRGGRDRANQ
jgi:hypothetical protein